MTEHEPLPQSGSLAPAPRADHAPNLAETPAHPETFENPGLPPHVHRAGDLSERAARTSEMQVVGLFVLSMLATLGFVVVFYLMDKETTGTVPLIGHVNLYHATIGVLAALSLAGIGFGVVHWAKTLMPDVEVVEERHELRSSDEDRAKTMDMLAGGAQAVQFKRRPFIKYALGGALGLFALPWLVQVGSSLGPLPRDTWKHTLWGDPKHRRLVTDPEGHPIKAADVTSTSVYHVLPEGYKDVPHHLNEMAKASVLVVRLDPSLIKSQKQRDWGVDGIVAYSKICTHVGCPVGLYEGQTHHLLCPCHQSTFDMTDDCKVIFGPAKRALPQLKISVDDEGYLVADGDFAEPVGPSYWEREL